ncbi:MAG: putative sulfate exporter family transporter, partial [Alistipes sp.]
MHITFRGQHLPLLKIGFIGLFAAAFFCSPAISLFAGILYALLLGNPFAKASRTLSKQMLQYCVVGLGFGMNLHASLAAGREGMIFTVVSVVTVMAVGVALGHVLHVGRKGAYLISAGT